jgi:DNA processing protein
MFFGKFLMEDFKYTYFLSKADGLGSVRIKKLIDKFGSAQNVLESSVNELTGVEGISKMTASSILRLKKDEEKLTNEFCALERKMEKLGIGAVTYKDKDYPGLLKKIYDPPMILYFKGRNSASILKNGFDNSIGIVGTRNPTDYGKKICETLAGELSSLGITVISGFARGIDTEAHKAVLAYKNNLGKTAAVFGNGIDVIYPPENKKLYDKIVDEGILLSEFEISAKPDSMNFPRRNRIISGLSLGIVIIESGKEGGALITARCALDQGREVFAVPGDVNSKYSKGTHELIKSGQAKLIENVDDILDELRSRLNVLPFEEHERRAPYKVPEVELKGNEKVIYEFLLASKDSVHIDSISESTGLNISDCLVNLLNLEFKGIIRQLPGKMFTIS